MSNRAKKAFLFSGTLAGLITALLGLQTSHSNHLGWVLLISGTGFIAIACLSLGILSLQSSEHQNRPDRSLWLPCISVLVIGLITPLEYIYLPSVLPRSDHAQDVGLILFAGGVAFYLLSLQANKPGQNLAHNQGEPSLPGTLLRPIPASFLLIGFGLGIGYSSWMGLLISAILLLPGLVYRIKAAKRQRPA